MSLATGRRVLARLLGRGLDQPHPRIGRGKHLVGQAQRMHPRQRLGDRLHRRRADHRLGEGAVEREVDLREPGRGGEAALVLEVVAAERADVVERPRLAAHDPLAGDEFGVLDRLALRLEHRLVEAGRQHVDQVDVRGELVMLLLAPRRPRRRCRDGRSCRGPCRRWSGRARGSRRRCRRGRGSSPAPAAAA